MSEGAASSSSEPAEGGVGTGRVTLVLLLVFVAVAALKLESSPSSLLAFVAWAGLLLYPLGELVRRGLSLEAPPWAGLVLALALGLPPVGLITLLSSKVGRDPVVVSVLLLLASAGAWWALVALRRRAGEPLAPREWDHGTMAVVLALGSLHLVLIPEVDAGFEPDGTFAHHGLRDDAFYLPYAQQLAREGWIRECPFFAGQQMVRRHHLWSEYVLGSFLLTTGRASDVFAARGGVHFLLGLPLLLGLAAEVLRRLGASRVVIALGLLVLVLPGPPDDAAVGGMTFFWSGLHGHTSQMAGPLMFLLAAALVAGLSGLEPTWKRLLLLQAVFLAMVQFRVNTALAWYPAAQLVLFALLGQRRGWRVAAGSALLAVGLGLAFLLLTDRTGQRAPGAPGELEMFQLADGRLMLVQTLTRWLGEAPHRAAATWAAAALPGLVAPLAVLAIYVVAYLPLGAATFVHLPRFVWQVRRPLELFVAWCCLLATIVALTCLEALPRWEWNLWGPLHYLIPPLGLIATARLCVEGSLRVRRAGHLLLGGVALWAVLGLATGRCSFHTTPVPAEDLDRDLVRLYRRIARETPRDAVLVGNGRDMFGDRWAVLLSERSLLVGGGYIYARHHIDGAARLAFQASLPRLEPRGGSAPAFAPGQLVGLEGRELILVGTLRPGEPSPPELPCEGRWFYRLVPASR